MGFADVGNEFESLLIALLPSYSAWEMLSQYIRARFKYFPWAGLQLLLSRSHVVPLSRIVSPLSLIWHVASVVCSGTSYELYLLGLKLFLRISSITRSFITLSSGGSGQVETLKCGNRSTDGSTEVRRKAAYQCLWVHY